MPSLLNVAECQNDMFASATASMRTGCRGVADVEQQAEAGAGAAGQADFRIDRDVVALVRTGRRPRLPRRVRGRCAAGAAAPTLRRARPPRPPPLAVARGPAHRAPRSLRGGTGRPWKMRGELTIAAVTGASSGTLITSRRNRAVFGSSMPPSAHPGTSSADRTPAVPET